MKKLGVVMATMLLVSGLLCANSALVAGRVDKRQVRQKKRIQQGADPNDLNVLNDPNDLNDLNGFNELPLIHLTRSFVSLNIMEH